VIQDLIIKEDRSNEIHIMLKSFIYITILIILSHGDTLAQCPSYEEAYNLIKNNNYIKQTDDCSSFIDTLSLAYHKIGLEYFRSKDLDSAIYFMKHAIDWRERKYTENPTKELAQSCFNAGYFSKVLGRNQDAIGYFLKCNNYSKGVSDNFNFLSWIGIGQIYEGQGDYYDAKRSFQSALEIAIQTSNRSRYCQAVIDYSQLLFKQEEYNAMIDFVESKLDSFSVNYKAKDYATINQNLGVALAELKEYNKSIPYLKKALSVYQSLDLKNDVLEMHNNITRVYQLSNDFIQAKYHLDQAKGLLDEVDELGLTSQYYDHLGEYFLDQGMLEESLVQFQSAIVTIIGKPSDTLYSKQEIERKVRKSDYPMKAAIYLKDKAESHVKKYQRWKNVEDLNLAIELFEQGDKAIDIVRSRQSSSATHLWWRSKAVEFYEAALELCALTNDSDRAFYFMEKSRGVLLYEALLSSKMLKAFNSPLATEYQLLRDSLNLISVETENKDVSREQLYLQVQELEDSLKSVCKECYESRFVPIDVDLVKYQAQLDSTTFGLYYFSGLSTTYMMMISRNDAVIRSIGSTSELSSQLYLYLDHIGRKSEVNDSVVMDLTNTLIGDIENIKGKNLIIYPSGPLFQFPFESLLVEGNTDTRDYLGQVCDISYDYSQRLDRIRDVNNTNRKILAFAPFIDETHLNYLSSSKREMELLEGEYSGQFFQGTDANSSHLKEHIQDCAILHLSTHGYVSDTTAPAIILSDIHWAMNDIYKLRTNANLVILSACETNIGEVSDSEGVLSIGRAFNYAGASSMISSLWKVNSTSTATILSSFYNHVSEGLPKFKALSQAKRDYLQNPNVPAYEKAPYYWAGLVYYGDDGGVELAKRRSIWSILGLLSLLALGGLFYFRKSFV